MYERLSSSTTLHQVYLSSQLYSQLVSYRSRGKFALGMPPYILKYHRAVHADIGAQFSGGVLCSQSVGSNVVSRPKTATQFPLGCSCKKKRSVISASRHRLVAVNGGRMQDMHGKSSDTFLPLCVYSSIHIVELSFHSPSRGPQPHSIITVA